MGFACMDSMAIAYVHVFRVFQWQLPSKFAVIFNKAVRLYHVYGANNSAVSRFPYAREFWGL